MWRGAAARVRFDLHDGLEVICRGHLDVYAPRGSYQLIIEDIEPRGHRGVGTGPAATAREAGPGGAVRPGPQAAAAAVRAADRRGDQSDGRGHPRFPPGARPAVARGRRAGRAGPRAGRRGRRRKSPPPSRPSSTGLAHARSIASVVTRGGGSLEDLWAFNEEPVVRAIAASRIPVVSAIGHEIDVTLSDLVADVRALTPSEAAELVAPAAEELLAGLRQVQKRLAAAVRSAARGGPVAARCGRAAHVFRRPYQRIYDLARRLDELGRARSRADAAAAAARPAAGSTGAAARLESLSPLAVLGRGYSLTQRTADGRRDPRRRRSCARRANHHPLRPRAGRQPRRTGGAVIRGQAAFNRPFQAG